MKIISLNINNFNHSNHSLLPYCTLQSMRIARWTVFINLHTFPANMCFTVNASHMFTSFILFNWDFAVRTFSDVIFFIHSLNINLIIFTRWITFMWEFTFPTVPPSTKFTWKPFIFLGLFLFENLFTSWTKAKMIFLIFVNKPTNLLITYLIKIWLCHQNSNILNAY